MYVRGGQSERSKGGGGGKIERYINGERERQRERENGCMCVVGRVKEVKGGGR